MVLLAHPFGNANVRAVLSALDEAGLLAKFVTALGWSNASPLVHELPANLRSQMARRGYELPHYKIKIFPAREIVRLLAQKMRQRWLVEHERGWASIDRVWRELDKFAAAPCANRMQRQSIRAVYAYEDCAERLFETAQELGVRRIYDLPIAYWETAQRLLARRGAALSGMGAHSWAARAIPKKSWPARRANSIWPSSSFVRALSSWIRCRRACGRAKPCVVTPFGSPSLEAESSSPNANRTSGPLRILFAGALTQRKGLADLFAAMKLVDFERGRTCRDGLALASSGLVSRTVPPVSFMNRRVRIAMCFG